LAASRLFSHGFAAQALELPVGELFIHSETTN
jgi:hypothetical protein